MGCLMSSCTRACQTSDIVDVTVHVSSDDDITATSVDQRHAQERKHRDVIHDTHHHLRDTHDTDSGGSDEHDDDRAAVVDNSDDDRADGDDDDDVERGKLLVTHHHHQHHHRPCSTYHVRLRIGDDPGSWDQGDAPRVMWSDIAAASVYTDNGSLKFLTATVTCTIRRPVCYARSFHESVVRQYSTLVALKQLAKKILREPGYNTAMGVNITSCSLRTGECCRGTSTWWPDVFIKTTTTVSVHGYNWPLQRVPVVPHRVSVDALLSWHMNQYEYPPHAPLVA